MFDAQSIHDSGVQSVHGTAAQVTYYADLDQIRATGHVNATITDPQSLTVPGSLRAESVTVDISSPEYVYNCSGVATQNDIDFTLLEHDKAPSSAVAGAKSTAKPGGTRSKPPTQLRVHAYSFDNAVLQTGSAVTLTGPASHLDMSPARCRKRKNRPIHECNRPIYLQRFLIREIH